MTKTKAKTNNLDLIGCISNTILMTGRLINDLITEKRDTPIEKTIELVWKRAGVLVETKERKEPKKIYPKLVDSNYDINGNKVLYYKLPLGMHLKKVFESIGIIESYLKYEIVEKRLDNHPFAHFSFTILSGKLYDYIEYSNEETLINNNGLFIPIGWSRRRLEQINLSEESSCHLMIGGGTGSGKSKLGRFIFVMMHLKYTPDQVKLWLCDLKHGSDIDMLGDNPRLVEKMVSEPEQVESLVDELSNVIKERTNLFKKAKCSDFKSYTKKFKLHEIILFVDEFTRLEPKEFKHIREKISVLTGEARSAGVHVIVSVHRPVASLISGTMKNNINAVVAFRSNPVSARVLLGEDDWEGSLMIDKEIPGRALFRCFDDVLIQVPYVTDDVCQEIMSKYQKVIDIKPEEISTKELLIQSIN